MRVLVVEDEARIGTEIADMLMKAGYVVMRADNGDDAWFLGETEALDAIVLDLGLPRLDGLSVLRRLRQAGIATPVLIVTARGAWMERVEGIDAGADDYLTKPFHNEELLARLDAVLRRTGGHASSVLAAGPIRIDTRRRSVTIDSRPVDLTPLEFRLLRYLVHHKGEVLSQPVLEDHIYDSEQEPGSNAMEALISRLRRKIGTHLIVTRRGHGYAVVDAP